MKILVLGATGATGRLLAEHLLQRGHSIIAIVRSPEKLPESVSQHSNCTVIKGTVLEMSDDEIVKYVNQCETAVSCLGHNMSFAGMYGKPRKLVTETVKRTIATTRKIAPDIPHKFILMGSAGVSSKDAAEEISFGQKAMLGLIRLLVPPHVDNEQAAEALRAEVGQDDPYIEWVVVRPDTLTNEDTVTDYEVHSSPTRSALFNPGKTSRINVAHFMAELISSDTIWQKWKGKMPVIYNKV